MRQRRVWVRALVIFTGMAQLNWAHQPPFPQELDYKTTRLEAPLETSLEGPLEAPLKRPPSLRSELYEQHDIGTNSNMLIWAALMSVIFNARNHPPLARATAPMELSPHI